MRRVHEIDSALAEVFGRTSATWLPGDPLLELAYCILNQRTTHAHAKRAMEQLTAACPDWGAVAGLPPDVLADLIRPAGLARSKAERLHATLHRIFVDTGGFSLDFLQERSTPEATRYLLTLPGVGPHTAALVLLFALGSRGVMPVETQIHRVAPRLGWTPHDASVKAVQAAIEAEAPDRLLMDLHVNLIRLGKRHCVAGTPDCQECPVSDLCASALRQPLWR